jgi:PKD repeat protein
LAVAGTGLITGTGFANAAPSTGSQAAKPSDQTLTAGLVAYQSNQLTVTGDGSKSSDDTDTITDYSFDFGDGTAAVAGSAATETHTYAKTGTYTVTLTVTDSAGDTNATSQHVTVANSYTPSNVARLLDTRIGTGEGNAAPVGAGQVLRLYVAGVDNVPATGATALVFDVTATDPTANSFLTVWPDGTTQPTLSTVNFQAGSTVRNLVTVPVSADGYIDFFNNAGSTDVIADFEGYYSNAPGFSGGYFSPVTPFRALDTRSGTGGVPASPVGPGQAVTVNPNSRGTVGNVRGIVLNVTVTNSTVNGGNLTVFSGVQPGEPNVSFAAGQTISNQVIIPTDAADDISFYNWIGNADVVADVEGYIVEPGSASGSAFTPTTATRILDTRNGTGGVPAAPVGPNSDLGLQVAGVDGIPADVTAVDINVTDVSPTATDYLTIGSTPGAGPTTDLHFNQGQILSEKVFVPVGPDGKIYFHNYNGSTDLVAGLAGYFEG